ncbi:MAG TPA: FkbM family methyltransferase [Bacteroidales bacterium]|mgnify:CR=1 FL=1|nr:FkbM family methyltransferase [Bacteroidales bacterium]
MRQLFYKIIYNSKINCILRNINKALFPIVPGGIQIPPSGILKIGKGKESLKIACNQTSYVTHLLFWNGYMNYEYTPIFLSLVKKIQSFYDVGANLGYYSLLAKSVNPDMEVVCFEPAAGPLFYLRENIRLNNFSRMKAEPVALSHMTGEIEFHEVRNKKYTYLEHNLAGESNAGSKTTGLNFVVTKVPTLTLDEYVRKNQVTRIDLMKLDTEGTEHLILQHATHVLGTLRPVIICETLYNRIEKDLEEIMRRYGYEFYNETGDGLVKVSTIIRTTDDGVRNCFFVHPDKVELIREYVKQTP